MTQYTVDLVIFEWFKFSRILRVRQIREFNNFAKIIIAIPIYHISSKMTDTTVSFNHSLYEDSATMYILADRSRELSKNNFIIV